jgi:hypothetical protein
MSKTKIISIALLIGGLAGLSLYLNRDWFASDTIQISHRLSPWMQNKRPGARNDLGLPVTFSSTDFTNSPASASSKPRNRDQPICRAGLADHLRLQLHPDF